LALVLVVDIDAQDRGKQVADVLAGVERIGRIGAGAVAGRDVEHAVIAEVQVTAVVSAAQKGDEDFLALRIDTRRVGVADAEARQARAFGQLLIRILASQNVANVTVTVLRKLRMKSQAVQGLDAAGLVFVPGAKLGGQVKKEVLLIGLWIEGERVDFPRLLT